jgi:hypothetical protein
MAEGGESDGGEGSACAYRGEISFKLIFYWKHLQNIFGFYALFPGPLACRMIFFLFSLL